MPDFVCVIVNGNKRNIFVVSNKFVAEAKLCVFFTFSKMLLNTCNTLVHESCK